jgi:hypothetical protein
MAGGIKGLRFSPTRQAHHVMSQAQVFLTATPIVQDTPNSESKDRVMSQAQVFLKPTPVVQDIPDSESSESGYTSHRIKRKPANTEYGTP